METIDLASRYESPAEWIDSYQREPVRNESRSKRRDGSCSPEGRILEAPCVCPAAEVTAVAKGALPEMREQMLGYGDAAGRAEALRRHNNR